jgi:DNA-binding SARP family transcriptional activator
VETPAFLEVAAHSLAAVLGVWLALTVLTRSDSPSKRVFAFVALSIAAWSSSIIVERLTSAPAVISAARTVEEVAAVLVLGGTLHFSLSVASHGHPSRGRLLVVALAYLLNLGFALPTILDPLVSPPHLTAGPLLPAAFGWAWVAVRLGTLLLAGAWLAQAYRRPDRTDLERRQLRSALATVGTGGLGGAMRFLPGVGDLDAWIGVSFVALALVCAGYAVFSAGIFFGPAVASRAFRTSLVGGLAMFAFVALLLGVEAAARRATGLNAPLFTVIVFVVVVTTYEPLSQRVRRVLLPQRPGAAARERLLRALGQPRLGAQSLEASVQPALVRLARALDVTGLAVVRPDGSLVAAEGTGGGTTSIRPIPLIADGEVLGELRVGPRTSGGHLDARDEELLRLSAEYVATALRTARLENEQIESLAGLARERLEVQEQASTLHAALVGHADAPPGLHVWALGPLRVERGGELLRRWGGSKAGTRQAEALFAFLFDRGERGVAKDEALELIWPDTDLDKGDLAFHRTMVGLRGALDSRGGGRASQVIRFSNDRYRLDPRIITWSDVDIFLARLDAGGRADTGEERVTRLEEARALYRGDYLDDCPFYGDSSHVEEQRQRLRERYVDGLVALGQGREAIGDRLAAMDAYREAVRTAIGGCAPAEAGVLRLTDAATVAASGP